MTVQYFMKIVFTVFEKFEIFMKGREKKTSRLHKYSKIFPTPKKEPCEAKLCWSAAGIMAQSSKGHFYN